MEHSVPVLNYFSVRYSEYCYKKNGTRFIKSRYLHNCVTLLAER